MFAIEAFKSPQKTFGRVIMLDLAGEDECTAAMEQIAAVEEEGYKLISFHAFMDWAEDVEDEEIEECEGAMMGVFSFRRTNKRPAKPPTIVSYLDIEEHDIERDISQMEGKGFTRQADIGLHVVGKQYGRIIIYRQQ